MGSFFTKSTPRKILEDEVTLIDKAQSSDPNKWEFYWMRTFRITFKQMREDVETYLKMCV